MEKRHKDEADAKPPETRHLLSREDTQRNWRMPSMAMNFSPTLRLTTNEDAN